MSYYDSNRVTGRYRGADIAAVDAGLRAHMLRVYNYMAGGLAVTGVVAYGSAAFGLLPVDGRHAADLDHRNAGAACLRARAELRHRAHERGDGGDPVRGLCGRDELSLGGIFLVFTGASIARLFFITASTYAAMSLCGYTIRSDLSKFGAFLFMGLASRAVIASLVNFFARFDGFQFVISIVGVIVVVGLTAHDAQRIKEMYLDSNSEEIAGKKAIIGALALYLDFINLFLLLLQLFGQRRQD